MSKRVVLASANSGKLAENSALLGELPIELVAQSDFQITAAQETGLSFIENAIIKARHAASLTGFCAIADDSGMCVDALNGEPGIYSARYAGGHASDEANVSKLLGKMENIPDAQRFARFECVIAYLEHAEDPTPIICQASWAGRVLHETRGQGGFGYDPIFFVLEAGCSCAELKAEQKNLLSHRGRASRRLVELLREKRGIGA